MFSYTLLCLFCSFPFSIAGPYLRASDVPVVIEILGISFAVDLARLEHRESYSVYTAGGHECDNVLIGSDDDSCVPPSGCQLERRVTLDHKFFGSDTYLCAGKPLDHPSGFATLSGDLFGEVFTDPARSTEDVAITNTYNVSGNNYGVVPSSWSYFFFVSYSTGEMGLLGGDCQRDNVQDIKEAERGTVTGNTYTYKTSGGKPEYCTKEVGTSNFQKICVDFWKDRAGTTNQHCAFYFQPLLETTEGDNKFWQRDLALCDPDAIQLSSILGVRYMPDAHAKIKTNNLSLEACRYNETHDRTLGLRSVEHGFFYIFFDHVISIITGFLVNILEPILIEIVRILYKLLKALLWYPMTVLFYALLDNTASFLISLGASAFLIWYTIRRIKKLTSSATYVFQPNAVYLSTTKLKDDPEYEYD